MGRKLVKKEMTYNPKRKGWIKNYRGKIYTISLKQLGIPYTGQARADETASLEAANAWWAAKALELEGVSGDEEEKKRDHGGNAFKIWSVLQDWKNLDTETQRALLAEMAPDMLTGATDKADRIVAEAIGGTAEPDRTVGAQIAAWGRVLHAGVFAGHLSAGRYDAYCRNVGVFADWAGPSSSIDSINADKMEAFHLELAGRVHALTYSVNYANSIMVAFKQWVNWLAAEKGLIPLPGNIRSKRISFKLRAKTVETFTNDEIKTILGDKCPSERTRLFILLGLNCGMYQNDIAELEDHEVNLTAGTLTRKRSKTGDRKDAVEVTYKLWPETVKLLRHYKSKLQVRNPDQSASRGGFLWFATDEGNIGTVND